MPSYIAANRPGQLVSWLASLVSPGADLSGLQDGGGVFCDFRPGLEEQSPSLSADMKPGGAVFNRFGGDSFEGRRGRLRGELLRCGQARSGPLAD